VTNPSIGFSSGTQVVEDERVVTDPTEPGDHERLSHYVAKDKLTEAMVMGTPVVALCGKVWVPSRAPEKFPVCPECKEIWESFSSGDGGGDGGSGGGSGSGSGAGSGNQSGSSDA
jgi:uncharacterized membrane protein YgcG